MARGWVWAGLCLVLAGCSNTPGGGVGGTGGAAGSTGGGSGGNGGSGGSKGIKGEYDICFASVADQCMSAFACVSMGTIARCMQTCTPPTGACPSGKRCTPQYGNPTAGYCAMVRGHFAACESMAGNVCEADAFCLSQSVAMPARCVPICDVGTFGNFSSVATCPDLPAELDATPTSCMPIAIGTVSGSLCSDEVRVGAVCDQAALRCNLDGARTDSDETLESAGLTALDPGALYCLPMADEGRCTRVCTVDGAAFAPCGCAGDPLCTEPTDPGLTWDCLGWPRLGASNGGCVLVEDCSANPTVCADNTTSGYTTCVATPYSGGPASVCALP